MPTGLRTRSFPLGKSRRRGEDIFREFLRSAGVTLGGDGPFDVIVHDDAFYDRALPKGLTAIREAYVDGWWDTDQLDVLTCKVLRNGARLSNADTVTLILANLSGRLRNRQNRSGSLEVTRHYDLGNDLFQAMLDTRMMYSGAYWENASTLDEAQEAKLDLICQKLALRPGMRLLDIGCGWGGLAKFAVERYGVSAVGITISQEQMQLAESICAGLAVELRLQDYRELGRSGETFDAVVSVGMFEHVGYKNYHEYMKIVRRCLKPDGLFLLQTIGINQSDVASDPWLNKYIFPNGMLPAAHQIAAASERVMVLEDWEGLGAHYDRTLMAWFDNFNRRWPELQPKYGDRFYRMWTCYLLTCAGLFRAREFQLWQVVFSPRGVVGGYASPSRTRSRVAVA